MLLQMFTSPWLIKHSTKKPVTTMLTYPWKCTVLHCSHLGNTWKPLVLMTRHFDYCPSASESSAPVVSRCFPGGYNVKLYISRGRLAWWLLTFLHSDGGVNLAQRDQLTASAGYIIYIAAHECIMDCRPKFHKQRLAQIATTEHP